MIRFLILLLVLIPKSGFCLEDLAVPNFGKQTNMTDADKPKEDQNFLKNIDNVLQGKYPEASHYKPPLPLTQKAWEKQKTETSSGVKQFKWQRGKIYKVVTREGMGTVFQLPKWDSIDQAILSDQLNFIQKEMNNAGMLYLEPLTAGADTSLKIIGKSGNIYGFYVSSESVLSQNISDQIVYLDTAFPEVSSFGKDKLSEAREESISSLLQKSSPEWVRELKFDPTKVRHDMEMRGDKTLAPMIVFRDERFTYLDFGIEHSRLVWPVAYQVVDKVDMPVNVRKSPDGRYMIVESINPITLRYGEKIVCIRQIIY